MRFRFLRFGPTGRRGGGGGGCGGGCSGGCGGGGCGGGSGLFRLDSPAGSAGLARAELAKQLKEQAQAAAQWIADGAGMVRCFLHLLKGFGGLRAGNMMPTAGADAEEVPLVRGGGGGGV